MQTTPIRTRSGQKAKSVSALILGLALGLVAPWGISSAVADCPEPPAYTELEAQIDEVWTSDAFDCLVVEHELRFWKEDGYITIFTDIANACGEDVWITSESEWINSEVGSVREVRVPDGAFVAINVDVEQRQQAAEGHGELAFGVIPESERNEVETQPSDDSPLTRVEYSYYGTPYDLDDWNCSDIVGCATSTSAPASPANSPLTWVMLGVGLVWVGRRSRRGSCA